MDTPYASTTLKGTLHRTTSPKSTKVSSKDITAQIGRADGTIGSAIMITVAAILVVVTAIAIAIVIILVVGNQLYRQRWPSPRSAALSARSIA